MPLDPESMKFLGTINPKVLCSMMKGKGGADKNLSLNGKSYKYVLNFDHSDQIVGLEIQ